MPVSSEIDWHFLDSKFYLICGNTIHNLSKSKSTAFFAAQGETAVFSMDCFCKNISSRKRTGFAVRRTAPQDSCLAKLRFSF